jgi:capsular polysaccharide biosynthesis protein
VDPLYPTEGLDPFVAEVRDARLTGPVPLALTRRGRIVKQTLIAPDADDGRVDRALQEGVREQGLGPTLRGLRRRPPQPTLELDCATVMSGRSNAYFHFVCDQLPKLRGIERYAELTRRMPTLILPREPTRWQRQLIALAGHADSESLEWPGGEAVARRLVVPSHPETTPGTLAWLRERLWAGADAALGESRPEPGARILISRRDARRTRYLDDEERLADALAAHGFHLLTLSEIGQAETIELFRRAEIVVGLHGSGLTNVAYCEHASVLEVFGRSVRPYFFRLAHAAGLPYRYELADESDGEVRIDADRIVDVVEQMLSQRQET